MSAIPENWAVATLGDVARSMKNGIYKPADSYADDGIVCLRMYNIDGGTIVLRDLKRMRLSLQEVEEYGLRPGDLLVNRVNSRELVGKAAVIPESLGPAVFESKNIRVRVENGAVNPRFVSLQMLQNGSNYFSENAQQVVGMASISQAQIARFPILVAPIQEQDRIVQKLDELLSDLDAGVAALKRARANLKRYRAAVLKAAVEGLLTEKWRAAHPHVEPASKLLDRILVERRKRWEELQLKKYADKGHSPPKRWKEKYPEPVTPKMGELAKLPEGWCWAALDQLLCVVTSGSRAWSKYYDRGSCVFVMAGNVRPMKLDLSERQLVDPPHDESERERTRVQVDDILVTIVGANTGDVCRVDIDLSNHFVCQSVALLRPVAASVSGYVAAFLNAEGGGKSHFRQVMYGQGRPHLGLDDIRNVAVALPPADEQVEICNELARQFSTAEVLEAQVQNDGVRALKVRQSILKHAFEGKLVPQDEKDEPASELLKRIRAARDSLSSTKSPNSHDVRNGRRQAIR